MSRDAIEDLVHRYSDAVVRRDRAAWGATWADDATWSLGPGRDVTGRDAILDAWTSAMDRFEAVVQTVLNGSVDLDGDTGTGRWYVLEVMRPVGGAPALMIGHYDDTYACTGGTWRFAERRLTQHVRGPLDDAMRFPQVDDA